MVLCFLLWGGGNSSYYIHANKLGVLLFQIDDLIPSCNNVKFVDDTSLLEISQEPNISTLQHNVEEVIKWFEDNNMHLNPLKLKNLYIFRERVSYRYDSTNSYSQH